MKLRNLLLLSSALAVNLTASLTAYATPVETIYVAAKQEKEPLLDTLQQLVSIESGSRDTAGLAQLAELVALRLKALGGDVQIVKPDPRAVELNDNPNHLGSSVLARFTGKGNKKILLIAHMDTVYLKGMLAKQPFHIEGDRAYGLGISDDKAGIATILHTLAVLKATGYQDYGLLTVLINGDEEIGSHGSQHLLSQLGSEHDAVFSCESSSVFKDKVSLTTAGIGKATLKVTGHASHAGGAPEAGRNALIELANQLMQMREMSDPAIGIKLNWTKASAGTNTNVIPDEASAIADVRVLRVADYDTLENRLQEKIKRKLIPDTKVELKLDRHRPPMQATSASREMAKTAQSVMRELDRELDVVDVAEGGGTDAAYAALHTKAPVIERFGLQGYGAHSKSDEYISIDSIVPRLYLLSRMVMEVSANK